MVYRVQENVFDKFFKHRESLIRQFKKGDISKREFLEEHYNFIQQLNLKPFERRIDSFEKGLYNYQYFNMLAKYCYMKAKDVKLQQKHPRLAEKFLEDSNYYYYQKDRSTMKLLEFLDFRNIEAYFVKVKSPGLKDKLFEIVLKDYENVIFHSKSTWLLERLKNEGVFLEGKKKSIIDSYINEKY
ncbi:hypothetical protein SAMN02745975_01873 [Geosporobacter subterraneus DSM 17957]|uniref:Uncharacterized protein n=1 Tax=Geosporobacter subterraneus DSM 17957 TaxID=1121919 RepID=A0A1M6IIE7_9FIRM|nr:DUF6648 family protein [Geosporobacter subterraneus]SHJ34209.1 hypothetical protein SAMN02745975_01873 [Geosporobacter subterraneus DSM 17957]